MTFVICGHDGIGRHARFRLCHLSVGFRRLRNNHAPGEIEYAPVMELVDMRDLGRVTLV